MVGPCPAVIRSVECIEPAPHRLSASSSVSQLYTVGRTIYAVLVGGTNGDLEVLELIDGRSYTLQCRLDCRTRQAENVWARVY